MPLWAGAAEPAAGTKVLQTYCVRCHGGEKPKADLKLEGIGADFGQAALWTTLLERVSEGSMPPDDQPQPTAEERRVLVEWIGAGLSARQRQQALADGRARLRRLNRIEYANTLRDLLGAEIDLDLLPEDGVAGGFDNVDAALDLSATLMERYLETADQALDAVLAVGAKPVAATKRIDLIAMAKQEYTAGGKRQTRFGLGTVIRDNDIVFYSEGQPDKIIQDTRVAAAGVYRFRIAAQAVNRPDLTFLIYAGNYGFGVNTLQTRVIGAYDVSDQPGVVEFTAKLEPKESIRISPYGLPNLYAVPAADFAGPGLALKWIEQEGPLVETWPPAPATRLLGEVDLATGQQADAEAILRRFAPRAFRRPVTDAELQPFLGLVQSRLSKGYSFAAALRVGLKGLLCSPDFLYLSARPGKLNDFDLATRLSYFLWSTTPDDELLSAAAKGELSGDAALQAQVERMLGDPRARAFTENFTGQWLSLRNLKATVPDKKLYPDFDELLELSMPQETHRFFDELLAKDGSILQFVDSDWSMLNERLAALYGIAGVSGSQIRRVELPAGSHRGGVLTQAAVLKVTANGTNTSPVVRGAWVLDRILGTPSPPPPKDVPAIEPDIRGATTIREQLAKHRSIASCASCHARIDPAGNALENFDVIGGWREKYRTDPQTSGGKRLMVLTGRGRTAPVGQGKPVEAADELPGGQKFTDIDGLKKLILADPDQFARGLTAKLLVYATGHPLEFADRATASEIVAQVGPRGYGFRSLIHAVVQSPTFRNK